jgi:hypothetical protein
MTDGKSRLQEVLKSDSTTASEIQKKFQQAIADDVKKVKTFNNNPVNIECATTLREKEELDKDLKKLKKEDSLKQAREKQEKIITKANEGSAESRGSFKQSEQIASERNALVPRASAAAQELQSSSKSDTSEVEAGVQNVAIDTNTGLPKGIVPTTAPPSNDKPPQEAPKPAPQTSKPPEPFNVDNDVSRIDLDQEEKQERSRLYEQAILMLNYEELSESSKKNGRFKNLARIYSKENENPGIILNKIFRKEIK